MRLGMLDEMDKARLGEHALRALHRTGVEHDARAFFHDHPHRTFSARSSAM